VRLARAALERDERAREQELLDSIRNTWQSFGSLIAGDADTARVWVKGGRADLLDDVEGERYDWLATELFYLMFQAHQNVLRHTRDEATGDWRLHQAAYYLERYPGLKSIFRREFARMPDTPFAMRFARLYPHLTAS
jgi:hypothetical protein